MYLVVGLSLSSVFSWTGAFDPVLQTLEHTPTFTAMISSEWSYVTSNGCWSAYKELHNSSRGKTSHYPSAGNLSVIPFLPVLKPLMFSVKIWDVTFRWCHCPVNSFKYGGTRFLYSAKNKFSVICLMCLTSFNCSFILSFSLWYFILQTVRKFALAVPNGLEFHSYLSMGGLFWDGEKKNNKNKPTKTQQNPNNCIDSGHDYLIIMFIYCNHDATSCCSCHVCLLSQVQAGDIFWSSFRKKVQAGERSFAYLQNIWQSFCFINRFNKI